MSTQPSLNSRNILLSYTTTDPDTQSILKKNIVTTQEDVTRFLFDVQEHSNPDSDWRNLRIERYEDLSDESLEALRWIYELKDLITKTEIRIIDRDLISIQDVVESITTHSIFSGIKILEDFGYCEPDDDFSEK